jgi:hypothetical protein
MASPAPAIRPPQNQPHLIDWLGFFLKILTVVVALGGAYRAWSEYKTASRQDLIIREHDLKQKVFEHKLAVFDQALAAAGEVVIATPAEFPKKLDRFKVIKHGEARMLGDVESYNAMVAFYDMAFAIVQNRKEKDDVERDKLDDQFQALSDILSAKIQADIKSFVTAGP